MHVVGEGTETILLPRAFQAYSGGTLEQLRDQVIADTLKDVDVRVVSIDTPGMGLNQSAESSDEWRTAAAKGNLDLRASATIEALAEGLGIKDEALHIWGYSMGAWMAAAIVRSPAFQKYRLRVGSFNLIEPVNDQDWGYRDVVAAISGEFKHTKRYFKETSEHFPTLPPRIQPENGTVLRPESTKFRKDDFALGRGMAVGFAPNLAKAVEEDAQNNTTGLSKVPLGIYRANGSFATRAKAVETTLEMLERSGQSNLSYTEIISKNEKMPHHHLIWHSMGAVALLAAHIRQKQWPPKDSLLL